MNQEHEAGHTVSRAEEMLDRAGQNIGFFAGQARQRVQHAATSFCRGRGRQEPSEGEQLAPSMKDQAEKATSETLKRAEYLVDQVEGTAGLLATAIGFRLRRATARLREEAEDMWAEAQSLREQSKHPAEEQPSHDQEQAKT
ncbi:MAG: hypothetical protein J2P37_04705 [Ktedonobacteraceae bacterium]|nr:hypothetical protein [Ktedonobacteraceae bacterium]